MTTTGFLGIDRLTKGPWQAFERGIARLLAHRGWDSYDVVGGSGDKGADILGSKDGVEKIFQTKFYQGNSNLSVDIVGDVVRAIEFYGIQQGVCVSNRVLGTAQKQRLETYKRQGYQIETFTGNKILESFELLPEWPTDKKVLRPYQREAIEKIIESFEHGTRKGLITLATGLGKTYVAGCFLRWLYENHPGSQVLILADKRELLLQFDKSIWTNLPKSVATHILHEGEKPSFDQGVLLSTFQSFEGYFEKRPQLTFDVVIVDEAHHAAADTFIDVIQKIDPKYLLGLTATPFRKDQRSIKKIFGEPLVKYDVIKALKKGYLANIEYKIKNDNIDTSWISNESKNGYTVKQLNKKLFIPERDEEICDTIFKYWNFKQPQRGIIFCNSSEHAERIEQLLRTQFNFPARSLTTRVPSSEERAKRLRLFKTGEIKILTCYDMLNEGVDVPDVDFLVYLRITHSRVIFLQQLGRGLRFKEGKTLLVLDFVADIRRLATVKLFKQEFKEAVEKPTRTTPIEELKLPSEFELTFFDETSKDFLNLVTADASELDEYSEDDTVYFL
ncbi:DEAD/DEAH box helicase family protein [Sediminibacterium roseum]|uniref:DEAD/DEAH box helicase family protein n=1 Tax=Sediminibacterium roseum TaxID=1978412 RepID=A0ABW9ZN34_9BACT|nr:DEAD/DEAH box helicase family protein [Sediminibacterium roseum]NCI48483.1 DEAD/DEAH box helicase family protein [Sediminibacterium roseum]